MRYRNSNKYLIYERISTYWLRLQVPFSFYTKWIISEASH